VIPADWREVDGGWEIGHGPLRVVLLPGIAGQALEFVRLVPLLRGRIRVLALPERADGTLADHAAALRGLPDHPVDVLGASFGGLLARALPPGRAARLYTVGTLPRFGPAASGAARTARLVDRLPGPAYRWAYGRRSERAWADDGADPSLIAALRLPSARVLAARLRAIAAWGLPDRAAVPMTQLWGATDPFVGWTSAEVEALGAVGAVVPGGHRPHLSHPAEVARWLGAPPTRS